MWAYINQLYVELSRLKQAIGMMMFVIGSPVTFFFRDTLGLAPSSPVFSAGVLVFSVILMIPSDFMVKLYRPNIMFAKVGWSFLLLSFWYMLFYNPGNDYFDYFRETGNYVFTLVFFFLLLNISNKVEDYVLPVIVFITMVGSLGLFYSIYKNPSFVIGMRAAIFTGDGQDDVGNPHVFGRNGLAGFLASCLLLNTRKILLKVACYANILFSIGVMLASQARGVLLAWAICMFFYAFFHFRYDNLKRSAKAFFTPRNTLFTLLLAFGVFFYLAKNATVQEYYNVYSGNLYRQWDKISATLIGNVRSNDDSFDPSAGNRVSNIGLFVRYYNDYGSQLIMGLGYKSFYLDVPFLEAWLDCGILGFLLFMGTNLLCMKYSIEAIRKRESPLTSFLGYFYWAFFVAMLTAGRPFDTIIWFYYMLMIRFMGLPFFEKPKTAEV